MPRMAVVRLSRRCETRAARGLAPRDSASETDMMWPEPTGASPGADL